MRDDFAAFILTHGRPDRVHTLATLERAGYTGKVYIVIDDEDKTADEYRKLYGDKVLTFSKAAVAETFDEGDNFGDRRAIIYARNANFALAEQVGVRYFIQLDDDYTTVTHTITPDDEYLTSRPRVKNLDAVLEAMVTFLDSVPYVSTIAFSQGGDFVGGPSSALTRRSLGRKAMNTFICDTQRPFQFRGRINEDVNTYTEQARTGLVMLTYPRVRIEQKMTQSNAGGMTDLYLASGTYVKSFYTVMYAPSCARIALMGSVNPRIHHRIDWNATAPLILHERHRKPQDSEASDERPAA
jgi:hypothetical protein